MRNGGSVTGPRLLLEFEPRLSDWELEFLTIKLYCPPRSVNNTLQISALCGCTRREGFVCLGLFVTNIKINVMLGSLKHKPGVALRKQVPLGQRILE